MKGGVYVSDRKKQVGLKEKCWLEREMETRLKKKAVSKDMLVEIVRE